MLQENLFQKNSIKDCDISVFEILKNIRKESKKEPTTFTKIVPQGTKLNEKDELINFEITYLETAPKAPPNATYKIFTYFNSLYFHSFTFFKFLFPQNMRHTVINYSNIRQRFYIVCFIFVNKQR